MEEWRLHHAEHHRKNTTSCLEAKSQSRSPRTSASPGWHIKRASVLVPEVAKFLRKVLTVSPVPWWCPHVANYLTNT